MILIDKPKIKRINKKSRLLCNIKTDYKEFDLYFETDLKYEKYLCTERADAFLIAVLPYAMRNNQDIFCKQCVTEQLLYNIREILIPTLSGNDDKIYNIKITAKTDSKKLGNPKYVGTGLSCGVDSFHVIHNLHNCKYKDMQLTHLCINSVGSFHHSYDEYGHEKIIADCRNNAKIVADKLGLELIITDSNLSEDTFGFNFYGSVHTYFNMFAVYCMQKFWKTYYYASTYDYSYFNLKNNSQNDCSYFDLLLLHCFSTRNLQLYSEGASVTRLQKVKQIADDKLPQKYLHVCLTNGKNCGKCIKCKRTILELYALNKLDLYKDVFDVDYFYNNIDEYMGYLEENKDHYMLKEVYEILCKNK